MKTDKSGKFVLTTPEEYIKMGEEHTDKDREISWQKVREMERKVNMHALAWDLIWRTGEDHGHQDRVTKSRATRSGNQATLTLLYKDHKQGNKTRPVASGNESFNLGLSNGISEVLEAVARSKKKPYSLISAEDLLARAHQFNDEWSAIIADRQGRSISKEQNPGSPERIVNKDPCNTVPEVTLIGNDVTALYPSLSAENTARIIRDEIMKSEIKFEGFDTNRGRAYLQINRDLIEDIESIEHLLPKRKSKSGTSPGMPSIDRKWNPHKQWEFERVDITKDEERKIIGAVAEVALKVLFNNFTYKFGEKYFHQSEGGPIGVRATGAAAQLVMEHWGKEYRSLLEAAGLQIFMLSGYVDDGRQISSVLKPGMRFVESQFIFSEEAEKADFKMKEQGESTNQRMARVCRPAMDSVNSDLKFTTESQEDFENERLPTQDFEMWLTQDGVRHSYYQKPMKTPP